MNENTKIWRFFDFPKFMSMLTSGELFFSNIKSLEDPYEGVLPKAVKDKYKQRFMDGEKLMKENDHPGITSERMAEISYKEFLKSMERGRNLALVNSWHMNDYESAFMWDVYSSRNKGIAVQSTYKKLDEALKKDHRYQQIVIGVVEYKDYIKDSNVSLNDLFFTKRKSFEHEKELRALMKLEGTKVYSLGKTEIKRDYQMPKMLFHKAKAVGRGIKVDLKKLIERIYLSPLSEPWYTDLVKSILVKYELDKNLLTASDLYTVK